MVLFARNGFGSYSAATFECKTYLQYFFKLSDRAKKFLFHRFVRSGEIACLMLIGREF